MRVEPKRKFLFSEEENFDKNNDVIDNHNEDLEEDNNDFSDYYSLWEDDKALDD